MQAHLFAETAARIFVTCYLCVDATHMNIQLIPTRDSDFDAIRDIYQHYVDHSTATFHTGIVTREELREKIVVGHPKYKSFVVEADGVCCGYAYLSQFNKRQAYDRTAEVSLYIHRDFLGRGIGKLALQHMEHVANKVGIVVLMALITAENVHSIRAFERAGYEQCACLKQVGEKFGRILDVVYYQKIL